MTKQELRDGMIIETRDGKIGLVLSGYIYYDDGYDELENYNDDLTTGYCDIKELDIVNVYHIQEAYRLSDLVDRENLKLIWSSNKRFDFSKNALDVLKNIDSKYKYMYKNIHNDLLVSTNRIANPYEEQTFMDAFKYLFECVDSSHGRFFIDDYVTREKDKGWVYHD